MSISRIEIDGCELIDSRVINVFKDTFTVVVEDIIFRFDFIDDKDVDAWADVEKTEFSDFPAYHVKIYNLNTGKVQGRFHPLEFGKADNFWYHWSLTGIADASSSTDKIVIFNLLREPIKREAF